MKNIVLAMIIVTTLAVVLAHANADKIAQPNIVIIYADDMGYGDLAIQNPHSKIGTPNLDNLARQGMRFTDAHSSSGICSPSRYALLTGKYHWRNSHGLPPTMGGNYFKANEITIAHVLKSQGYTTAAIGKWHLGWDWRSLLKPSAQKVEIVVPTKNPKKSKIRTVFGADAYDWSKPIPGGPLARGFDHYFGDGTINFPPYAWIQDDRVLKEPTTIMVSPDATTREGKWEVRPGPAVKNWKFYDVLPTLTQRGVDYISKQTKTQPFFLYFALPSPHAPIIPNQAFEGKTNAGGYGDFMFQTDHIVGEILKALDKQGLADNTLVIFTSDNGPENYAIERYMSTGHNSSGNLRGFKRDIWEAGHRVPFIVRWPGKVKANTVVTDTISQVDLFKTLTSAADFSLPQGIAEDSYNMLPLWLNGSTPKPIRNITIHNTFPGRYAIRMGDWVYLNHNRTIKAGKDYNQSLGFTSFSSSDLLFNLKDDLSQKVNLAEKETSRLRQMKTKLNTILME